MKKTLVISGLIIGSFGIIFSLLPHDMHNAILGGISNAEHHNGIDDDSIQNENMEHSHFSHGMHVTIGVLSAVIGLGLAFAGWKIFD